MLPKRFKLLPTTGTRPQNMAVQNVGRSLRHDKEMVTFSRTCVPQIPVGRPRSTSTNRLMRTRMSGGVGGDPTNRIPIPIYDRRDGRPRDAIESNGRFLRHRFSPKPTSVAIPISLPKRTHVAKEAVSPARQIKAHQQSERQSKPNDFPATKPWPCVKTLYA